jgi:CPA2 family monovalent cation:H+ antiporter-2
MVRTQDDHDLEKLRAAGATEVVPEAIEGSLMLASHALALVGVPMRRVIRIVQDQRDARYNLLRGLFPRRRRRHRRRDASMSACPPSQLPLGAKSVGKRRWGHLALHAMGVRVVSLRRATAAAAQR